MSVANDKILFQAARDNFNVFCHLMDPAYQTPKHIRYLIGKLEALESGQLKKAIISMPPRNGKSRTCSELFPAWYLGRNTNKNLITATYSQELSSDFGRKVRGIIKTDVFKAIFPECELSDDSRAVNRFSTTNGCTYFAVGVGGSATGRGGDMILLDDALKGRLEADSPQTRKALIEWYGSVLYTRLSPTGSIAIIGTRWHPGDLTGHLLESQPDEYELINFPAFAEVDDVLGRKEGDLLWPERFDVKRLEDIRATLGSRDFAALYQCRPVEATGGMFKTAWWNSYKVMKVEHWKAMNRVIIMDPARVVSKDSDYTAIITLGFAKDGNVYVLDVVRDKLDLMDRVRKVFELHKTWQPKCVYVKKQGSEPDYDAIRNKQNEDNYRFRCDFVLEKGRKVTRIERLIPYFEAGKIWWPESLVKLGWDGKYHDVVKEIFDNEYSVYPICKNDDGLDSLSSMIDVPVKFPTSATVKTCGARPISNFDWLGA